MALRIKLARGGSVHNPVYRVVVGEAPSKRDGKFVEWIGTYSPKAPHGQLKLKLDRADYWMGVGAKPTDTVRSLINKVRRREMEEEASAPAPQAAAVTTEAPPPATDPAPATEAAATEELYGEESAALVEGAEVDEAATPAQESEAEVTVADAPTGLDEEGSSAAVVEEISGAAEPAESSEDEEDKKS